MKTTSIQPNFTGKISVSITDTLLKQAKNSPAKFFELVENIDKIKKLTDKDTIIMLERNKSKTPYVYLKNNRLDVESENISYNLENALNPAFVKLSEVSMLTRFMRKKLPVSELSDAVKDFPHHDLKLNGKTVEQIINDGLAAKLDVKA